jgi:hypothetical protein
MDAKFIKASHVYIFTSWILLDIFIFNESTELDPLVPSHKTTEFWFCATSGLQHVKMINMKNIYI